MYSVHCVSKNDLYTFAYNFGKYYLILKIFHCWIRR